MREVLKIKHVIAEMKNKLSRSLENKAKEMCTRQREYNKRMENFE